MGILICVVVVVSHFGTLGLKAVPQRFVAHKIGVHCREQRFGGNVAMEHHLVHCRQHVDRRREPGAVKPPIVVFAAQRDIAATLKATVKKQR